MCFNILPINFSYTSIGTRLLHIKINLSNRDWHGNKSLIKTYEVIIMSIWVLYVWTSPEIFVYCMSRLVLKYLAIACPDQSSNIWILYIQTSPEIFGYCVSGLVLKYLDIVCPDQSRNVWILYVQTSPEFFGYCISGLLQAISMLWG